MSPGLSGRFAPLLDVVKHIAKPVSGAELVS